MDRSYKVTDNPPNRVKKTNSLAQPNKQACVFANTAWGQKKQKKKKPNWLYMSVLGVGAGSC